MEKKHVKQGAISVYFTTGIYVFPDNSNICSLKDLITGVFNSSPLSKTVVFFYFFYFWGLVFPSIQNAFALQIMQIQTIWYKIDDSYRDVQ